MGTMTLIERLRALGFDGNELGHEAADEIERLRMPSDPNAKTVTIEAILEQNFPDKVKRTSDGVLRTYYAGFDLSEACRVIARQVNKALVVETQNSGTL